ncbi:fluoride efflux transporter FluC [Candidatus Laterigemmans baculatus]|nr:CrcB family protein [Candidatus Laterigemmans baculatus]
MWERIVLLALAGAAGTLARVGIATLVQRLCGAGFPWGTLAVNSLGCFLFGLVWALADERMALSYETRAIVLGGFMGAFTTFSTFAFETSGFLSESQWGFAAVNLLLQNTLGVMCVFLGFAVTRLW